VQSKKPVKKVLEQFVFFLAIVWQSEC